MVSSTIPPVGCRSADKPEWKGFVVFGEDGVMEARKLAAPGPVNSCCSLGQMGKYVLLSFMKANSHVAHVEHAGLLARPVV